MALQQLLSAASSASSAAAPAVLGATQCSPTGLRHLASSNTADPINAAEGDPRSGSSSCSGLLHVLLQLPPDLFARNVVDFLSKQDKQCFRRASRLCRHIVNAATHGCVLDASCPTTLAAAEQVPRSFPWLRHINIINTATPAAGHNPNSCSSSSGCVCPAADGIELEQQLPGLLRQLPQLCSLSYEGPADRRQPGLDITPALAAAAAAAPQPAILGQLSAATATPESPAASAQCTGFTAGMQGEQTSQAWGEQQQQQQQQRQQLTHLQLRAGRLPDSLMEVVGQLTSLKGLQLTATTAIATAPLAKLSQLSKLVVAVTPPLLGALAPLAGLRSLAVLHLAAISPARGWGAALQLLQGCGLVELQLVFADVCDTDMAALSALSGLTRLDLHCSRHLTTAAVPYIAQLARLSVLQLAHTGLQLGPAEMLMLGAGCRNLTQLHAEFALRGLPDPGPVLPVQPGRQFALSGLEPVLSSTLQQQLALQDHSQAQQQQQQQCDSSSGWPPLTHLSVTHGCSVSNVAKLLHNCPALRQLELEGLGPNGDEVAVVLARRARQLTALQLSGCSSMSMVGCGILAAGLRQLRELSLVDVGLPASHLLVLLQGLGSGSSSKQAASPACPCDSNRDVGDGGNGSSKCSSGGRLTHLHIERCRGMTSEVLSNGVAGLHNLLQLELVGCDNMYGEGALLDLVWQLSRLQVIRVWGCKYVGAGFARSWEAAAAARLLAVPGSRSAVASVTWQATG